jgi:hypothetical protein
VEPRPPVGAHDSTPKLSAAAVSTDTGRTGSSPTPDAEAPPPPNQAPAAGYDAQKLGFALRWARNNALDCHSGGRASGNVSVEVSFVPEGRVERVQLQGEPIASAPVAKCIETYFESMLLPAYDGTPFTIVEQLTLR